MHRSCKARAAATSTGADRALPNIEPSVERGRCDAPHVPPPLTPGARAERPRPAPAVGDAPPAIVAAPSFQRLVGASADTAYSILTLIPLALAASAALPGLASGGAFLGTLSGWFKVGLFTQLKLGAAGALGVFVLLIGLGVTVSLRAVQWAQMERHGATLGKRAVGMQLVQPSGARVGFWRGVVLRRWVWLFLLSCPPTIALWFESEGWARVLAWAALAAEAVNDLYVFTPQRRTLNDRFAGTVVVSTSKAPIARSVAVATLPALGAAVGAAWMLAAAFPAQWQGLVGFVTGTARGDASSAPDPVDPATHDVGDLSMGSAPSAATSTDAGSLAAASVDAGPTTTTTLDAGVGAPTPVADGGGAPAVDAAPGAPAPEPEPAALYSYVDEHGVAHIVGSLDEVPARFRARAQRR